MAAPHPAKTDNEIHSVTGRRWVFSRADERIALTLAQRFSLPDIAARIMASRGITLDEAGDFLAPTLRNLLPDPFHLKDMDKAAQRVAAALAAGEKMAVFGDYDVDGATSAALLKRFMDALELPLQIYVPDRMKEGYGPNAPAMQKLAADGIKLLITVDCGTTAFEPLQAAKDAGMDVIVLDHHAAEPRLPAAFAVVNPKRVDQESAHTHLAAVGVTFLFLVALNKVLRGNGFFTGKQEPDLKKFLDLVALGTVCDVVPLRGVNRAFVHQGLKVMGGTENIGMRALLSVSRSSSPCDTYTAGFLLGPRVNAGGRVGQSSLGATLLSTRDEGEATRIAAMLEQMNEERRAIEQQVLEEALQMVPPENAAVVMVASDGWHPGVIGLAASRLKERYGLPTLVTAFGEGSIGKGSCRSVSGINIGDAIIAARQEGLLINGGGHDMAAGFSVMRERYEDFRHFMEQRMARLLAEKPLEPLLQLDGMLAVGGVALALVEKIQALGPFGAGNPEPRFAVMDARLIRADTMGKEQNHLRLILGGDTGGGVQAVVWRAMENDLGPALTSLKKGSRLHVAGHLRINSYAMREDVQLVVEDVAFPGI
jgi:single-stranded-DNA-specific exonuclease